MMTPKATIKSILDQVQAHRLSKEEALARIKSLHATPAPEGDRAPVHYFREVWLESPIQGATSNGKAKAGGTVLVLDGSPEIVQALRAGVETAPVVWARPAAKFERIGAQEYSFRVGQKEDVERLLQNLAEDGVLPTRIVQVGSRAVLGPDNAGLAEQLEWGLELALFVFQAAVRFKGKEPIHQVYLHFGAADAPSPAVGAVVGLFKELGLERPNFSGRVCRCESMDPTGIARALVEAVWPDSDSSAELAIAAADRRVWSRGAERIELKAPRQPVLRERGVCLITGGAGGLGFIFAEYLARVAPARLVLLGRSAISEKIRDRLRTLERLGAEARYFQADVSKLAELEAAVSEARTAFGPIHAVIHAAGVMPYGRSTDIDLEAIRAVWKSKIQGTLNLDAATRGEPLDWMALFSSIASVIGVAEACGYAAGNAFLDHFAAWRAGEVRAGRRVGRTTAFNWPLWEEGGMQVQGQAAGAWRDWMWTSQGLRPLTVSAGVAAFEAGIFSEETRIIVAQGDADRIARTLRRGLGWRPEIRPAETGMAVKRATIAVTRNGDGRERLVSILKGMVGELLSVPEDAIDVKAGLGEFGFDSISLKSFAERLNDRFKLDLMPSVFFNHASLNALTDHLRAAYPEATRLPVETGREDLSTTVASSLRSDEETPPSHDDPIAIVGLSGLLPGSPTLEAFWSNLVARRDLISEVPASRWDATAAYQAGEAGEGKSNSKWGGFIDDVEGFDARFFGVPPWEADRMDPQHRLFLETVWNCLEAAGEAPADLAGRKVGVFVGIQFHEYQDLLALAGDLHMYNATGNGHAMIANRLSFFLDLRGPSEAVDTACSSSLVALNRAVSAIRAGECESALVGGVSLILSPGTLVVTSQMGILSPDGRCKVFDAAANGYVKGEGILAAYLMPLSRAQRDGYPVWGLVRGIGVNHGGRASSLTAPNSQAQSDLVAGVLRQSGVDPETVGYIEAHGTGTELGDPVEVEGLKSAFATLTGQSNWARPFCGLGSVKSNIGHLEPAAGLAGVAKVLLAMRHRTLPATLHLKTPNPYLKLEGSPFFLVTESRPWDEPRDKSGQPGPRRAGVSSFGFGGANAHVILEEYRPVSTDRDEETAASDSVFVLSAKSEAAVRNRLAGLSTWLASRGLNASRQDLARTLQMGRDHFEYRLAVVASSLVELGEILQVLLRGGSDPRGSFGKAGASRARLSQPGLATAAELAEAYVRGDAIAWSETGAGRRFRRLALPGYPFEKTQHWFRRAGAVSVPAGGQPETGPASAPAPMKLKALSGRQAGAAPGATSPSSEPDRGLSATRSGSARAAAWDKPRSDRERFMAPMHGRGTVEALQEPSRVKMPADTAGDPDLGRKVETRVPSRSEVARTVASIVATALYLDGSTLDEAKSFVDLGADSVLGVEIIRRINTAFGLNLPASKLYEHPTVAALSAYVAGLGAGSAAATTPVVPAAPPSPPSLVAGPGGSRVVVNRSGDIDDLIYATADPPVPGEREIQVEVMAASVILPDLLCVRGLYPTMPPYPFTPGFEFAGVVRAVGPRASRHQVGDRVFGVTGDTLGAHALRLNVREELAAKVPAALSLIEAATVPEAFLTAYFSLIELGRLVEGERLLIGSAASGTGLAAIQLAKWRKAETLALVGSDEKVGYLRDLGISQVVNYREGDLAGFCAQVIGPRGVDVALNMLTGEPREAALRCLAPFGRFLDLAVAGLRADGRTDLSSMVSNQVYFSVDCRRLCDGGAEKIQRILGRLAELLTAGIIQPLKVNRVFDFSEARQAYALVRDRAGIGKTLLCRRDSAMAASDERPCDLSVRRLPTTAQAGSFPEVAVIGMAGRFPGAENLEQFWKLLCQGRCAVREVPANRWAAEQYFDPDPATSGKTYSKWGGFLEGIDQFDPLFFSLAPTEAEQMDPQQRLFLETAWHAMEDAGYAAEGASGVRCGVFVGVGQGDYVEAVRKAGGELSASLLMGSSCSMIGARLAYFMNLTGPAVALDTACSSSLLAIYQACQSLAAGDSDLALAGGVCVMTTPAMYVMMSKARMLSPTGLCRTFDQGADGFVPGEGVGVIVLKLLARALRDGDHIYGVIKGGGSNQDGATNGITAPNPASQKALEMEVYRRAGVDPASIGYVEAHGTGTKLGDPVEMDAITEAFRGFTQRRGYCAIGSVKTNIGHTLSAAGVASAIKTLLCLHHQKLVPSLHYRQPNEHIAFDASPFYVNTELRDWPRPDPTPRRAAVSSFGFSGTNVHLVFEEAPERAIRGGPQKPAYLFTLSARTDDGLRERVEQLSAWLAARECERSIEAVAYTLNAGRMHFRKRCFVVADSVGALRAGLGRVHFGEATRLDRAALAEGGRRSGELIGDLAFAVSSPDRYKAILHELGGFYLQGVSLNWARLHDGEANRRISLPGYPFRRRRYWASGPTVEPNGTSSPAAGHPLLDANGSGSAGARFTRRVRPLDWFVQDHQVRGVKTVPGVVYLEMARAAAAARFGRGVSAIRRFVIRQPVQVQSEDVAVEVRLAPAVGGAEFELHTPGHGSSICHAQGVLEFGEARVVPERISIQELESQVQAPADKLAIYEYFQAAGLQYGAAFRALSRLGLDSSREMGIARVDLPSVARADAEAYYLHPALLDGAWQSIAGWGLVGQERTPFALPFEVQEILLFGPLTETGYVRARHGEVSGSGEIRRYDVQFFDTTGAERCRVTGLTMKSVEPGRHPGGIQLLRPVWVPREVSPKPGRPLGSLLSRMRMQWDPEPGYLLSRPAGTLSSAGGGGEGRGEEASFSAWFLVRLLVLDDNESRFAAVRSRCPEAVQVRRGDAFDCRSPGVFVVRPESTEDFGRLLSVSHPGEHAAAEVLSLWGLDERAGATEPEAGSLLSAFALTRALIERGFSRLSMVQACRSRQAGLMSGWAKSLRQEHAGFRCVAAEIDGDGGADLPARLLSEFDGELDPPEIRLTPAGRLVVTYERDSASPTLPDAFRKNGVYLITGGLGGLGRLVAEHLVRRMGARVALLGRSALTAEAQRWVDSLAALGGEGAYWNADVARLDEVRRVVDGVRERFGAVHGVFHLAGLLRDSRLVNKTADDMRAVLSPKIRGAINLDLATRDLDLDFLVFFSSVAGALGSAGQCDYAAANGFLDRFAEEREARRAAGHSRTRTLSINWPWWKQGGMRPAEATIDWLRTTWGLAGLETEDGLRLLEEILRSDMARVLVLCGDERRWAEIAKQRETVAPSRPAKEAAGGGSTWLRQQIIRLMAEQLKVDEAEIDQHEDFSAYGFDSISLTEFSNRLNRVHRLETTPALFFEYMTVASLADHLAGAYPDRFTGAGASAPASTPSAPASVERTAGEPCAAGPAVEVEQNRWIAVIAMEGRFPGAANLDEFWSNLETGRDCVSEVPAARWDWRKLAPELQHARWGGFIEGIELFDAGLFGISRREAELMDPQQRLFLETVWTLLERAGYPSNSAVPSPVGLFVGVSTCDYAELLGRDVVTAAHSPTGLSHSILVNRASYLLNLTGPSEAVNTACSSSLVALHRAARSLREGECDLAVAAGVNAILTPTTTLGFLQAGMLSRDGRCKTFDAHADGYVRGEGVGAVLLKRFKDAVRDGDAVLGVILGSAVNHGGRTNTLTAPNPTAQSEVVRAACRDAGIAPSLVSYIEAHGTGTVLGDPIEFNGLVKAFTAAGASVQPGTCGLGSVKSNLGHLEAAAGIAGVIKVLLALQHRKLPATLHVREVNPYLRLEGSPFHLITETEAWVARTEASTGDLPRRAGVSSFGFGGANAHVVIGEAPSAPPVEPGDTQPKPWSLATISARDEKALLVKARELAEWLRREGSRYELADICYTLNAGRHHLLRRRALVVRTREELLTALDRIVAGQEPPEGLAGERVRMKPEDEALFRVVWESLSKSLADTVSAPEAYREKLRGLAGLYLKGYSLDWNLVHAGETRRRVPLPTYPFQRESYWVPKPEAERRGQHSARASAPLTEPGARESGNGSASAVGLVSVLASEAAALLKVAPEEIRADVNLSEFGFDSINFRSLAKALSDRLGVDLSPDVFFAHPTLTELAEHLVGLLPHPAPGSSPEPSSEMRGATGTGAAEASVSAPQVRSEPIPIAVVGMGGVFPGSPNVEAFWQNLVDGRDLVGEVPASRWDWRATYGDTRRSADKTNSKWGGFVADADCFDAEFFGISPREAEMMDPQQRLFLHCAWTAIESAGVAPERLSGTPVGVFLGIQFNDYQELLARAGVSDPYGGTGNAHAIAANRVSYLFNLTGPSETIDTACSSSLVAVHRAVQSLRLRECDAALAGGVSLMLSPSAFVATSQLGALSPDGRCRVFDARANGYVRGEGAGAIFLMRLSDAAAGGYPILGIIKGSAVNHGGRAQSLTAPNARAQSALLQKAYADAGVDPGTVGYLEAHGTGTELGDPVEVEGLKMAFAAMAPGRPNKNLAPRTCGLGSVKSNIGHLEAAAGIAGVIKVLLAMQHGTLPASLHFQKLNPFIRIEGTPFYVVDRPTPWDRAVGVSGEATLRRAGVSSFGFGGANAHVVIEEPSREPPDEHALDGLDHLFLLSARTEDALRRRVQDLQQWLCGQGSRHSLATISRTLNAGRGHYPCRAAFVARSQPELIQALDDWSRREDVVTDSAGNRKPRRRAAGEEINRRAQAVLAELRGPVEALNGSRQEHLLELAALYCQGEDWDWSALDEFDSDRPRIALPTYPFARTRYWIPTQNPGSPSATDAGSDAPAAVSLADARCLQVLSDFEADRMSLEAAVKELQTP